MIPAAMEDRKIYPQDIYVKELQFFAEVQSFWKQVQQYENPAAKSAALSVIPVEKIKADAKDAWDSGESSRKSARDEEIYQLSKWFKEFFQWMNSPKCHQCGGTTTPYPGNVDPTPEERRYGAGRVEGYKCNICGAFVRFPRYNDPEKLLETRTGRCGEWANCFTLCATAYGFDARLAFDKTDHVWTEIYSEAEKKWLHCDPCETLCDTPLVYEEGWGKQLTYVLAFSKFEMADVTWRYSRKHKEVLQRRLLCREHHLLEFILHNNKTKQSNLPPSVKAAMTERFVMDLAQMLCPKLVTNPGEQQGRVSGDYAWRKARSELGSKPGPATKNSNLTIIPHKSELEFKELHLQYFATTNKYVRRSFSNQEVKGWKNLCSETYGIARKEEFDWRNVYLAREEGRNQQDGQVVWKVDLHESVESGHLLRAIYIKLIHKTFEEGIVDIILCAGDQCIKFNKGQEELSLENVDPKTTSIELKVCLRGGSGASAWQHAQLFRCHFDAQEPGFEMKISFA